MLEWSMYLIYFFFQDLNSFEYFDVSDEFYGKIKEKNDRTDRIFSKKDVICIWEFHPLQLAFTSSCVYQCHILIIQLMFSNELNTTYDECLSAFKCNFLIPWLSINSRLIYSFEKIIHYIQIYLICCQCWILKFLIPFNSFNEKKMRSHQNMLYNNLYAFSRLLSVNLFLYAFCTRILLLEKK